VQEARNDALPMPSTELAAAFGVTLQPPGGIGCPRLDEFMDGGVDDIVDWLNASDASPPSSEVAVVPRAEGTETIQLELSAQDPLTIADQRGLMSAVIAASQAAALHGFTLFVKVPNAHAPGDVPSDAMLLGLERTLQGPLPMTCVTRLGCVLLAFDQLATAASSVDISAAADDLAEVMRTQQTGALVPGSSVLLFDDVLDAPAGAPLPVTEADAAAAAQAGFSSEWPQLAAGWPDDVPTPLRCRPPYTMLLHRRDDGSAILTLDLNAPVGKMQSNSNQGVKAITSVHCRVNNETLNQLPSGPSTQVQFSVPAALLAQGCFTVLVEAQVVQRWPEGSARNPRSSLSRPMPCLVSTHAPVVAQIAATCALVHTREHAAMDAVLRVCGHAFRPDAPLSVQAAAARSCLILGWDALLHALLRMPHISAAARGALVLVCEKQLRRSDHASTRGCISVVHGTSLQLWPPSAPEAAATLLRIAREEDGFAIPELAVESALQAASAQKDDGGASAVLRAMQLLLAEGDVSHRQQDAAVAADSDVKGAAVDEEARYATFLMVYNHNMWTMVAGLGTLSGLATLKVAWVDILSLPQQGNAPLRDRLAGIAASRFGAFKLDLLRQVRLHPFLPGAMTSVLDAPWERMVTVARLEVVLVLLFRQTVDFYMAYLLARYLSTRQKRAHLMANPALGAWLSHRLQMLTFASCLFYAMQDTLLAWGTHGATVEWPASINMMYAVGEFYTFKAVLFPPRYDILSVIACFLAYWSMLLFAPRLHIIVLKNYGYALQIVALVYSLIMAPSRNAARKQLWRQTEAADRGSKQKRA
jgi:hypothetical protein